MMVNVICMKHRENPLTFIIFTFGMGNIRVPVLYSFVEMLLFVVNGENKEL